MSDSSGSAWAVRLRRPRWTDPRLLVGLVLVATATVAGGRVVATADDTVPVWSVVEAVRAGDPVRPGDLVATPVRIDGPDPSPYLPAGGSPPTGVYTHDLAAGELVAGTGVAAVAPGAGAELSLAVEVGDAPFDLGAGDLVDVWAVPTAANAQAAATGAGGPPAERVLAAVPVVDVAEPAATLGATSRQVLLGIDDAPSELGASLARLAGGTVVLVRVGG